MIVDSQRDPVSRTLTLTTEFTTAPDKVWRMWDDPRRLERWWAPPTHPVTVTGHDLRPGGKVTYFATFPDGTRRDLWWDVELVEPPRRLEFVMRDPDLPPITIRVTVEERPAGTRMVIVAGFDSDEGMRRLLEIGFAEGLTTSVAQIDDLL